MYTNESKKKFLSNSATATVFSDPAALRRAHRGES